LDVVVTVDGSCTHWGKMQIGYVIRNQATHRVVGGGNRYLAHRGTNNIAEYRAIAYGCEEAHKLHARGIVVYTDSELVFRQLGGQYRVRNDRLKKEHQQTRTLLKQLKVSVRWHGREEGDGPVADALSKGINLTNALLKVDKEVNRENDV